MTAPSISNSLSRGLTRNAEAIHVGQGALTLAVRVNSEVFRLVAIRAEVLAEKKKPPTDEKDTSKVRKKKD